MIDSLIPSGAREEFLELSGGRVRVLRAGTPGRPAIVLLHGGGLNNAAAAWYRLYAPLGETYDVIAPDFPGFGATTGIEPRHDTAALADLVAQVMDRVAVDDAVVVGVSMGGETALQLALSRPYRVRGLVLISASGLRSTLGGPLVQFAAWLFGRLPERAMQALIRTGFRSEGALKGIAHDPAKLPDGVIAELRREADRPDVGLGLVRYNAGAVGLQEMRNNLLPDLGGITVPALLVHGDRDAQVPPESSRHAAGLLPNARYVAIPECGHWSHLEDHDRFYAELTDFLATLD